MSSVFTKRIFPSIKEKDSSNKKLWSKTTTIPPIFIMGLHRSGTTFLYESLSQILPVSKLTAQHVVFYPQLIHSHLGDQGKADRKVLENYFNDYGQLNRGRDNIVLNADTAEEYGWILKEQAGSFYISPRTVDTMKDLINKVCFMDPGKKAIILKNPWDIRKVKYLVEQFPNARFIFLRRDPMEILNSEVNNLLYFSKQNDPLLNLLSKRIRLIKVFFKTIGAIRRITPDNFFQRIVTRALTADIISNLHHYEHALKEIPVERRVEITYGELVRDTPACLLKLSEFVDLPASQCVTSIQGKRRNAGMLPCVKDASQEIVRRLGKEGLSSFLNC